MAGQNVLEIVVGQLDETRFAGAEQQLGPEQGT
jgi:hypothetical protein